MKVKELVKELQKYNQELNIMYEDTNKNHSSIEKAEVLYTNQGGEPHELIVSLKK